MSAMHSGPASDDISNVSPTSREPSDAAPSTNIFLTLPSELLRRVVYFLHPNDAVILTSSNIFEGRVNVNALHPTPFPSMQVEDRHYHGDIPQPCEPRLQMPCDVSNIHSITLRTQWKDQGWGNRKGGLMIVATPATATSTTRRATATAEGTPGGTNDDHNLDSTKAAEAEDLFDGGLIVATTHTCAPHEWEQVEITFYPNDRDHYYLWFRVGGGGGHMLSIKDAQVQVFVFDDAQATYQKTYECLYNVGCLNSKTEPLVPRRPPVLPRWEQIPRPFLTAPAFNGKRPKLGIGIMFYQKLLLGVCRSLQQMKECEHNSASPTIISPILECLLDHGVPIDKQSVSAIEDFVQTDFDEANTDWDIYEENIRKLRQRHNVDDENNPTQDGDRTRPRGIAIPLRHATVNGFRVVIPMGERRGQQQAGEEANDNGEQQQHAEPNEHLWDAAEHGIRIEPIRPGGNDPMENHAAAALPQVINNPDGTFTINLGELDDLAAMPLDGADAVHHQNPDRGMEVDPPDVGDNPNDEEMFGIARAAMAAVFGFQNDNDGNAGNNNNNNFPMGGFQNFFQQVNGGRGGVVGGGIFVGGGRNDGQFGDGEFQFQNIINLAMNNNNNDQRPQPAPTVPVNDQVMTDNDNDDDDEDAEEVPFM